MLVSRSDDYWDQLHDEWDADARQICPHCKEPIGHESSGSNGDQPYHHLPCLDTSADRVDRVVHSLHRLSLAELRMIGDHIGQLLVDGKWDR